MNMNFLDKTLATIHFVGFINLTVAFLGIIVAFLMLILVAHLSYALTGHSVLYQKRRPVKAWDKRFYPSLLLLCLSLGILIWWLEGIKQAI